MKLNTASQKIGSSFDLDSHLSGCSAAIVLGAHVEHTVVDCFAQVFGLTVLHLHTRNYEICDVLH